MTRSPERQRAPSDDTRMLLPGALLDITARRRSSGSWGEWLEGSLMHCDVTGFTAMSERLASRGKEGAEIMAGVMNQFFERMLGIAGDWGGDQVKFGGDAMLLLFRGRGHADRAAACGLDMQAGMKDFRRIQAGGEEHTLRMRVGIHSGRFFAASAGQAKGLRHFMLLGPDVNVAAETEPAAAPGEVVITGETARLLAPGAALTSRTDGLFRVRRTTGKPPRRQMAPPTPRTASRYVSPLTRDALHAERISGISGEHRRVTVMFVALEGLSELLAAGKEGQALAALEEELGVFLDLLDRYGGYLSGSDVAEHYDKLIAVFGAPVSQERPEENAIACAVDYLKAVAHSSLEHRIGINSGAAFAGMIGSSWRREFTVIGDTVNTAARLMTAGKPGHITVADETLSPCRGRFEASRLRPLRVKGKAEPLRASRVIGLAEDLGDSRDEGATMVGRERELRSLVALAQRAQARGQWAYISGEPGIGKSTLTAGLAATLRSAGWQVVAVEAQANAAGTAYAPWLPALRSIMTVGGPLTAGSVNATISRLAPQHSAFAPLVCELLGIEADDESIAGIDPATRRAKLHETVVALLGACAAKAPLLLLFEDVHWADQSSLSLLSAIATDLATGQLLCVTAREPVQPSELSTAVPALSINLSRLDENAARSIAAAAGLGDAEIESVVSRGAGNPLFLRELARAGKHTGDLPDNVQDLLVARTDRLPPEERSVLRVASVLGPRFERTILSQLLAPALTRRRVDGALTSLTKRGFVRGGGDAEYMFGHALMHEAVYGGLPFRERRRLHSAVIGYHESTGREDAASDTLLWHAEGAEDRQRIVRYATLAGDRDVAVYAIDGAIARYSRALDALAGVARASAMDRSLLLERIGDCEQSVGRFEAAATHYEEALETAPPGSAARNKLVPAADRIARPAVLAQKVGYSIERSADYDGAMPWFDRALAALPPRRPRIGAQICAARSGSLFRKGAYEDAIAWGERALRYATAARSPREIAYARNMLGNSHLAVGRMNSAIRHFRHAVRTYHEIGDLSGQAKSNNNLGTAYFWEGVLDGALYHYQVARRTDERIGDVADAMIARNNVAEVLYLLGRTDEAIDELEAVVQAKSQLGGMEDVIGLVYVNLSRCQLAGGDIDAARASVARAETQLRRIHADALLVEATQQRAEIFLAAGDAQRAIAQARRALKDARRLGLAVFEPACERILGKALVAGGRASEGLSHLREAVALARRGGAAYEEARSAVALGTALIESGNAARGQRQLTRAQAVFRKMGADVPAARIDAWLERTAA